MARGVWGRTIYRRRLLVLFGSGALLVASIAVLLGGGALSPSETTQGQSIEASQLVASQLQGTSSTSSFTLVFTARTLGARDPRYRRAVFAALTGLRRDRRTVKVVTPYDLAPVAAAGLTSRDGHSVLAVVAVKAGSGAYPFLRALVHSTVLGVVGTGALAVNYEFDHLLAGDLSRAEYVSLPLALLLLILVFGTLVAAALPLSVGLFAVVGGLGGVYALSRLATTSEYALNIVTLIGLGVAIDYSLFIVTRFREEMARGRNVEDALAVTMSTIGRAVLFSGLTVAIGLSGLLFFQGTFLTSIGLAGAIVVLFAVLYALTLLPAILALLGPRVNKLRLPFSREMDVDKGTIWRRLALWVTRRPVLVLALTVPLIIVAGSPFLQLRLAGSGAAALPPTVEAYQGYRTLVQDFPGQELNTIGVVVHYAGAGSRGPRAPAAAVPVLTAPRTGALYDLSRTIAALPHVLRVDGPVDVAPSLRRGDYARLYAGPPAALPAALRAAVKTTVGRDIAVLLVQTLLPAGSEEARALVKTIRQEAVPGDGAILVTGATARDLDLISLIVDRAPLALAYIVVMTLLVLFLLLGSVVAPLKAVVTDVLSIAASFGALVWIFQQGHLRTLLNFTPAAIDPTVPVLLFCIVFGLSMDYEVLLLTRMKEVYIQTGDNQRTIVEGLDKSGKLITGAAAIMIAVFSAFALAGIVIIKSIGLGMALAIFIDATIVRTLIVPATMRLLGNLNWWAPAPLARLHRRLAPQETPPPILEDDPLDRIIDALGETRRPS